MPVMRYLAKCTLNLYDTGMKGKSLLLPTNDFVFKKVFAENTDLLGNLLSAALDVPEESMESIMVTDAHLRRETIEDKDGILDIKVRTRNSVLDVELQVRNQPSLARRVQYYLSSLYVEQIRSGEPYTNLNKAISILITGFDMYKDSHWRHRFRYYDREHDVEFHDSCEILVLELPKVGLSTGPLPDWLRFVNAQTEEDFMQAAAQNPLIGKAYGIIRTLSYDEETRLLAQSREKALRDAWDREEGARAEGRLEGLLEGREEGRVEGRVEGREEKSLEDAISFLRLKVTPSVVAQGTGLPLDKVVALAKSL